MSSISDHAVMAVRPAAPPAFARVLCAVDGSPHAMEAIRQAATLCGPDGRLTLLAVGDAAAAAMESSACAAAEAGAQARPRLSRTADVRQAVLKEAAGHDLLVLGAHGFQRVAGYLLGGTALAALHRSPTPVLVARPVDDFPRRVVLATDGSPLMASTVRLTAALARRHDAQVTIAQVSCGGHPLRDDLEYEAAILRGATGVEPAVVRPSGHVPTRVAGAARDAGASLVVTGSRMLGGWHAVTSVSERIVALAPCSVLVLRQSR